MWFLTHFFACRLKPSFLLLFLSCSGSWFHILAPRVTNDDLEIDSFVVIGIVSSWRWGNMWPFFGSFKENLSDRYTGFLFRTTLWTCNKVWRAISWWIDNSPDCLTNCLHDVYLDALSFNRRVWFCRICKRFRSFFVNALNLIFLSSWFIQTLPNTLMPVSYTHLTLPTTPYV